jgi:endonuclease III-like uncharacterized protein
VIRELFESALAGVHNLGTGNRERGTGFHAFAHPPTTVSQAPRPPLVQVYNEMHGLIVGVGKHYCWKKTPRCEQCPLRPYLPAA